MKEHTLTSSAADLTLPLASLPADLAFPAASSAASSLHMPQSIQQGLKGDQLFWFRDLHLLTKMGFAAINRKMLRLQECNYSHAR